MVWCGVLPEVEYGVVWVLPEVEYGVMWGVT